MTNFDTRLKSVRSDIESNGGKALFRGLYEGDRRVSAKLITTEYGKCWLLADSESELISARGKSFLPTGANSRVLKSLNLVECEEWDSAYAAHAGERFKVYVEIYRTGDEFGLDAERKI